MHYMGNAAVGIAQSRQQSSRPVQAGPITEGAEAGQGRRGGCIVRLGPIAPARQITDVHLAETVHQKVIGRFPRNLNVMGMTFPYPGRRDPDKLGLGAQFVNGCRTAVTHAGPQTTD